MHKFIISFTDAHKDFEDEIGAYAASLGELSREGIPFVDGFIITSLTYFNFLHTNKLLNKINNLLSTTNFAHPESILQTAINSKRLIMQSPLSKDVTADIHNAYKNLAGVFKNTPVTLSFGDKGNTIEQMILDETDLLLKIKEAWAAHFSAEPLLLRHKEKLDHFTHGPSLIIQKELKAAVSGHILTADPVTHDVSKILIEITDDGHYEIQKNNGEIIQQSTSSNQLTSDQLRILTSLGKQIETYCYFPQEIYWAIEKKQIYILRYKHLSLHSQDITDAVTTPTNNLQTKGIGLSQGIATGSIKIIKERKDFNHITFGDVIVTKDIPEEYLVTIKKASAVITEKNGKTSPVALMARHVGIPAVGGVTNATNLFKPRQVVMVNGTTGEIHTSSIHVAHHKTATRLYLTVNTAEEKFTPEYVDGVVIEGNDSQSLKNLEALLSQACQTISPAPVIYKIADFDENNKNQLGFRGTHRAIHNQQNFKQELTMLSTIRKEYKNIWMMLPFIRNTKELMLAKEIMKENRLSRDITFKLWIAITTPANVLHLQEFIDLGIDGVCIDMDELTTLFTGVDAKSSEVAHIFDPLDSSVLWAVETVIKTANKQNITTAIIGDSLSQHPSLIKKVVHWGITSIGVSSEFIASTRKEITQAERVLIEHKTT